MLGAAGSLALAACVAGGGPSTTARPATSAPTTAPPASRPQPVRPVSAPVASGPAAGFREPEIMDARGLEGVIREDGPALLRRFGAPQLEVFEGDMRKLQFSGEACVLDVYLYPLSPGTDPVATWVEARRRSDGAAVDRAACVAALSGR